MWIFFERMPWSHYSRGQIVARRGQGLFLSPRHPRMVRDIGSLEFFFLFPPTTQPSQGQGEQATCGQFSFLSHERPSCGLPNRLTPPLGFFFQPVLAMGRWARPL